MSKSDTPETDSQPKLQAITPESLASALWDCEQLRTGRFTQPQFRQLCEDVLTREMGKINTETNQSK